MPFMSSVSFFIVVLALGFRAWSGGISAAAGVHVVNVECSVGAEEEGARRNAGELMHALAGKANVVTHTERDWGAAILHCTFALAGDEHQVLSDGVPVPRDDASGGGLDQQQESALHGIAAQDGSSHTGGKAGEVHKLVGGAGGVHGLGVLGMRGLKHGAGDHDGKADRQAAKRMGVSPRLKFREEV